MGGARPSLRGAAAAGLLATLAACGPSAMPQAPSARVFLEGPARWLMLPEEVRQARNLDNGRDAIVFIERFWQRRDPTPGDPENPYRATFFERSVAADRLYGEGNKRGSMTDRGHVLVLFGSPSGIKLDQQAVPAMEPDRDRRLTTPTTRLIGLETWTYNPDELPARFTDLLPEDERQEPLTFEFTKENNHTRLQSGERNFDLAVLAAVRD